MSITCRECGYPRPTGAQSDELGGKCPMCQTPYTEDQLRDHGSAANRSQSKKLAKYAGIVLIVLGVVSLLASDFLPQIPDAISMALLLLPLALVPIGVLSIIWSVKDPKTLPFSDDGAKSNWSNVARNFIVVVVFFGVGLPAFSWLINRPPPTPSALDLCLESVRERAQFGSKAEFQGVDVEQQLSNGRTQLHGRIDLLAFTGAMLPHKFYCEVDRRSMTVVTATVFPD